MARRNPIEYAPGEVKKIILAELDEFAVVYEHMGAAGERGERAAVREYSKIAHESREHIKALLGELVMMSR